jgi:hypothetical protein
MNEPYSIFRILGNETPPRDDSDARLRTLEFILDNEPEFPNAIKYWIINCIHDKERRELICKMLSDRNMCYDVVHFCLEKYLKAKNRSEKVVQIVNINKARNLAISHGILISNFTFVLDGDCFFSQNLWKKTYQDIEQDQIANKNRKYYSIPINRVNFDHVLVSDEPKLLAEPVIVFRHDSNLRFDESIPFGKADKLNLLYKLGHSQESDKHHILVKDDLCKSVGMVHHVTASDYEIEINPKKRMQLRKESIDRLILQVEEKYDFTKRDSFL